MGRSIRGEKPLTLPSKSELRSSRPRIRLRRKAGFGGQESGERERKLQHRQTTRFRSARKRPVERGDVAVTEHELSGCGVLGGMFRA
jgi:hypothetical protein